jgi:tRNA pseudouridine55 synthase
MLPLVMGRATRLARFMSASDKSYEARVRLGVRTDTADAEGQSIGARYEGPMPAWDAIDTALDAFRGSFLQQPPAFSAKRIGGRRSYELARADRSLPALPAVPVEARAIEVMAVEGEVVTLRVDCSAGFYVRSLARDLGERLGTGAHLATLRRTRSADFGLDAAIGLEAAERDPARAAEAIVPMSRLLKSLSSVVLTADGLRHAGHGRELQAADWQTAGGVELDSTVVRLLDESRDLIGLARRGGRAGSLHPFVVLV